MKIPQIPMKIHQKDHEITMKISMKCRWFKEYFEDLAPGPAPGAEQPDPVRRRPLRLGIWECSAGERILEDE